MNSSLNGRELPPDYEYFWNRPFGRGTCALLTAVALAGVGLPVLDAPAISQEWRRTKQAPVENATWGESDTSFKNAIWGNRGKTKESTTEFATSGSDEVRGKLDKFLQRKYSDGFEGWVDVIIKVDGKMNSSQDSDLAEIGGKSSKKLVGINALAVKVPAKRLDKIAKFSWAKHISEDVKVAKFDEFTMKSSLADVAFANYGVTGKSVAVAVLDSGIRLRPDLNVAGTFTSRVVASVSFVPGDITTSDPCGHGTHVAGIIAGNGRSSTGSLFTRTFYGIAREANIVNVRVLDGLGGGKVSTIIQGVDWVIANKDKYNIRVLNMSLGHAVGESYKTDPLCQAVERAWKAGIVVVTAAGNSGRVNAHQTAGMDNEGYGAAYGSIEVPGNSPYCITVGATKDVNGNRSYDQISTYSSRGPSRLDFVLKPDLVAPGNRIVSLRNPGSTVDVEYGSSNTIPFSYYTIFGTTLETWEYFRLSGTSMAAPVVAGAAALMIQRDPTLSPDTVKARLMLTADKWMDKDGRYDICSFGAGYVNIPKALGSTVVATQPAASPTLSRDANGYVFVEKTNVTWGDNVIWGMQGVGSLNVIWGEYIAPVSGIVDNIIWGSNVVWGTAVWSDNIIWGSTTDADIRANNVYGED